MLLVIIGPLYPFRPCRVKKKHFGGCMIFCPAKSRIVDNNNFAAGWAINRELPEAGAILILYEDKMVCCRQ